MATLAAPTGTSAERAARLDVLRNHRFVAEQKIGSQYPALVGERAWLVAIELWRQPTVGITRLLHALQTLAQLARTDRSAWASALVPCWPPRDAQLWLRRREHHIRNRAGRYGDDGDVIGLQVPCSDESDDDFLSIDSLLDAVQRFCAQTSTTQTLTPMIPIPIRINLSSMIDIAVAVRAITTLTMLSETASPCPYRVVGVCLGSLDVPDASKLAEIGGLAQRGLIMNGYFPYVDVELTAHNAAHFVSGLHAIMPSRRSDAVATTHIDGVRIVSSGRVSSQSALLSAVGDGTAVREVIVLGPSDSCDRLVRWLAFSLFSSSARHDLKSFRMRGSFANATLIDAFRQVVQARDPLAALYSEYGSSVATHVHTRISSARFYLFGPDQVAIDCCRHSQLRVLTTTSTWWSVLLPGWGQAWVHASDARVSATCDEIPAQSRPQSIRNIVISDADTLEESWLALVGDGVEQLTLIRLRGPAIQWSTLKKTFPNLTSLHLQDLLVDRLSPLYAPDARDMWNKLETLSLCDVTSRDSDFRTDAVMILRALSDCGHGLAKSLRSLTLIMTLKQFKYKRVVNAALKMLDANKGLRWFSLTLPANTKDADTIRNAFHKDRGVMGMRETYALLSAVAVGRHAVGQHFDSNILTTILQFAGCRFFRHVEFIV